MSTETVRPTADGTYHQHETQVGGTTNLYACIDEAELNEADCIQNKTTNATNVSTFVTANPTTIGAGDTINSVTLYGYCAKESGGTPTGKLAVYIGAGLYYGDTIDLTTTTTLYSKTWTTNPATDAAWTLGNVQDMEVGFSSTMTYYRGKCFQLWAVIDFTAGASIVIPVFMNQYRQRRI